VGGFADAAITAGKVAIGTRISWYRRLGSVVGRLEFQTYHLEVFAVQ